MRVRAVGTRRSSLGAVAVCLGGLFWSGRGSGDGALIR